MSLLIYAALGITRRSIARVALNFLNRRGCCFYHDCGSNLDIWFNPCLQHQSIAERFNNQEVWVTSRGLGLAALLSLKDIGCSTNYSHLDSEMNLARWFTREELNIIGGAGSQDSYGLDPRSVEDCDYFHFNHKDPKDRFRIIWTDIFQKNRFDPKEYIK